MGGRQSREEKVVTQEEIKRRFWKRMIAAIVIVFVVLPVLIVGGLAFFRYKHQKTASPQTVVPNLKGLDLKTAESRAAKAQLHAQVMLRRWDIEAPIGTVVGQIPEPGIAVPAGTTVGLDLCVEDPNKARTK